MRPDPSDVAFFEAVSLSPRPLRNGLWAVYERRDVGLWGDLRAFDDTRLATAPRFHQVGFHVPLERVASEPDFREQVVRLLCDLFVATDAFYGRADSAGTRRALLGFRSAAADDGRMWIPRWDDPRFVIYDRWVEDVWWLNFYGPAYIRRWGRETVERLGVRTVWLANGAAAVWSTELPADPAAGDSITGYPHKARFYETLGKGTFIHETPEIPEPGLRVPTLDEHAQTGGYDSIPFRARTPRV